MESILDEIANRIAKWKEHQFVFELFEKYLKKKNSIDEEEMSILIDSGLLDEDTDVKALIKSHNFHHPPISTLVLDDQLGSPLLSGANSKDGKWFVKFIVKHRHSPYFCNIFILLQHYKAGTALLELAQLKIKQSLSFLKRLLKSCLKQLKVIMVL